MTAPTIDDVIAAVRAIDDDPRPGVSTSVRRRPAVAEALQLLVALGHGDSANAVSEQALVDHLRATAHALAVEAHYADYPEDRPSRAEVAAVRLRRLDDPLADEPALLEHAESLLADTTATDGPTVDEVIAAARVLAAGASA